MTSNQKEHSQQNSSKIYLLFFAPLFLLFIIGCSDDGPCDNCEIGEMEMEMNEENEEDMNRLTDSLTLVALYNSTDGENWDEKWDLSAPMEEWFGITLNYNGTVQYIELQSNGLVGTLPHELKNFTEIEALEVRSGEMSGTIPDGLSALTSLRFLRFDDNGLSGNIPAELTNLANLEVLDLAENEFTGTIPTGFGALMRMDFIDLSKNNLTGEIPSDIGELTGLVFLTLNFNDLSGCFPDSFFDLCNTFGVDLSFNPQLPWSGDFEKLCDGFPQLGAPCELNGSAGTIDENCNCVL